MADDEVREINPVQWFDERDPVTATKDFRPRAEPVIEEETIIVVDQPTALSSPRKRPAKD